MLHSVRPESRNYADVYIHHNPLTWRKNEELCDAILEVEGRSIPCHRVVLAAGIPYFKAMFTSANMAEANMKKIQLKVSAPREFLS